MSGNTIGRSFCVTTFGESHGPALGAIVDGCPPGLELVGGWTSRRISSRAARALRSTRASARNPTACESSPACSRDARRARRSACTIDNVDARSRDYEKIKDRFRPGHADYAYQQKYGFRDYRGGGRSSARITVATVAAGAIARKYLREKQGIDSGGLRCRRSGRTGSTAWTWPRPRGNPFFCADPDKLPLLEDYLRQLRRDGDSAGARVSVAARGVPPGLGEPMFDRLDADIAFAMMGINAAKAVEIGDGVAVAGQRGSEHRDELTPVGIRLKSFRRDPRRHQLRPGRDRARLVQADLQHPGAGPHHRRERRARGDRDDRPARPLRRTAGRADRRGDAPDRADGPCSPAPGPMCRRASPAPRSLRAECPRINALRSRPPRRFEWPSLRDARQDFGKYGV